MRLGWFLVELPRAARVKNERATFVGAHLIERVSADRIRDVAACEQPLQSALSIVSVEESQASGYVHACATCLFLSSSAHEGDSVWPST